MANQKIKPDLTWRSALPKQAFYLPYRTFGFKKSITVRSNLPGLKSGPWLQYNQMNDKVFCFACLKASTTRILSSDAYSRSDNAFMNCDYTNWKDTSRNNTSGFPFYERAPFHRHCTSILARSHRDIAKMMSTEH